MTYVAGDIFLLSFMKLITIYDKTTSTLNRQITINIDSISLVIDWIDTLNPDKKSCKIYFIQDQCLELKGDAAIDFMIAYNSAINGVVDKNLTIWQKIKIFCFDCLFSLRLNKLSAKFRKSNRSNEKGQI